VAQGGEEAGVLQLDDGGCFVDFVEDGPGAVDFGADEAFAEFGEDEEDGVELECVCIMLATEVSINHRW